MGPNPSERLRSFLNYVSQAILLPDNKIGWLPWAIAQGRRLLREGHFDAIYATAPPFTDLLIGRALKRMSGLPLIVDFRDAWVANQFVRYATPLHRLLAGRMEHRVLSDADAIITINGRIADLLASNTPLHQRRKITVIPHGFDPEDFSVDAQRTATDGRLTITYTGSFYERTTPLYFLRALRKLIDDRPGIVRHLRVLFVGRVRREDEEMIDTFTLRSVVEVVSYVDHRTSVGYLMNTDILWLMIGRGKGSEMISTGKLFEYLGARKPILASVPEEGEIAQIVRASGNGIVVPPDDVEGIAAAIEEYYKRYKKGLLKPTSMTFVEQYDRKKLAQRLAEVLDVYRADLV
jgi:glycosyltransferase involved in cell wall biosynthesis